jgi:hypothetical protein
MKIRLALGSLAALLLVAACSSGQPPSSVALVPNARSAPAGAALAEISVQRLLATVPGYVPHPAQPDRRKSWMSPAAKSIKYLLYVSDAQTDDVNVYDYTNRKRVGTLTGFDDPIGQCVDAKGNVYIANAENNVGIVEYAHGGSSPLKTFVTNGYAFGCSVDREGDLAATNSEAFYGSSLANICVWRRGTGSPTCYQNRGYCSFLWPAGYDDKGNLIAIGYAYEYEKTEVCAVPSRVKSMVTLSFNEPLDFFYGGSTMWDGKYITLSNWEADDEYEPAMYQATLSGSTLTAVAETVLTDTPCDSKTEIPLPFVVGKKNTPVNRQQGKAVIGSNTDCSGSSAGIGFWRYPKGGNPYQNYAIDASGGEAVSIAP